jgi:branched-subunit amino acid transport protein
VAIIPALVAPLVAWPANETGDGDPARFAAAAVTLVAGMWTRNVVIAILSGAATLYGLLYLIG